MSVTPFGSGNTIPPTSMFSSAPRFIASSPGVSAPIVTAPAVSLDPTQTLFHTVQGLMSSFAKAPEAAVSVEQAALEINALNGCPPGCACVACDTGVASLAKGDSAQAVGVAAQPAFSGSAEAKATLEKNLTEISKDPEGARLVARAADLGVNIGVGNPGAANVLGVTYSSPGRATQIVVRDPNNIKTIIHELVHAVSTNDGNSKLEEGSANVIGERVSNRLAGTAVRDKNTVLTSTAALYPELGQRNNILTTLSQLGINA